MRGRTFGGRRTPTPPTNPPEQQPTSSEHDIWPESMTYDFDGPSAAQQERHDSPILNVVREYAQCSRDGCDAAHRVDYIYTMDGMSDRLEAAVRHAAGDMADAADMAHFTREEAVEEYVAQHAELVDYDEGPVLGVRFGDDTFGYWEPSDEDDHSNDDGECYGHMDEATRLGI